MNSHRKQEKGEQSINQVTPAQQSSSPTRRYRPRIYGYPCFVLGKCPGWTRLEGGQRASFMRAHEQVIVPDCETFWTSLPSRMSSSFWFFDSLTVTPSSMATCRTICTRDVRTSFRSFKLLNSHLLAQEISDLEFRATVLDNAVDGEMGVYRTHLVLEALQSENSELRVVL